MVEASGIGKLMDGTNQSNENILSERQRERRKKEREKREGEGREKERETVTDCFLVLEKI